MASRSNNKSDDVFGLESQVDSEANSATNSAPTSPITNYMDAHDKAAQDKRIPENPFDSTSSKILFDAIDQLQSCGLVIVGGQSTGKSSLLQSLTDIPFPVGAGLCTRFATRIVSRRTAPGSDPIVKITITDPDVKDAFGYPVDNAWKQYPGYVSDRLEIEQFRDIMEEITTKYMGIRPGTGVQSKNFATQVLRVELSGPNRSHFSILDVPGVFEFPDTVKPKEMTGIKKMVEEYMRQPANIVICVADAITDLSNQGIFNMAINIVEKKRLVGVFTKCDLLQDPVKVVEIASGGGSHSRKSMHDGWFVVRNRTENEGDNFDLKDAEDRLFSQPRWAQVRSDRKGSSMLKQYLGNLLCARIRDNFPAIQSSIQRLLQDAQSSRKSLGDPRSNHNLRQQYLREILDRYRSIAFKTINSPGKLPDSMEALRVWSRVKESNETFTEEMRAHGHVYQFEDQGVDSMTKLTEALAYHYPHQTSKKQAAETREYEAVMTPPSTPPKERRGRKPLSQDNNPAPFVSVIQKQLQVWQTTELLGLIHPEVIKVLYKQQSEKWQGMAEAHINKIASDIEIASNSILQNVCSPSTGSTILFQELSTILSQLQTQAKQKALSELEDYCRRDREHHLQTTDKRFEQNLRALRSVRLLNTYHSMPQPQKDTDPNVHIFAVFGHCHHSIEKNMIDDAHDIVKVYYELSLEAFVRYVTKYITSDFISYSKGPLMGLSTDWMFNLDEEEVERLAREDEDTLQKRAHFDDVVEKLTTAGEIVQSARNQTQSLGGL
ncbi:putative vacuolar sorting protein VPS1 [Colletotrichum karsti]|uniref:Vacuolar sorting protein VPS1 n=1 Tax=Colletotrichum karsti TaxID=1095194 RepID=A0A9P6HZ26_9PEZI|nr:putative vacuolar sorting protein VPS1 [Colletotrichum karsti]KAF9873972.1 putative vacuolar sorting protein VPS1 [Colletotrichum karsti]